MTDSGFKWQNTIVIRKKEKWGWKKLLTLVGLPKRESYSHNMCLDNESCIRFILKGKKKNGLRKGSYYELYWGGEKVDHDPFATGIKKQVVEFGSCA